MSFCRITGRSRGLPKPNYFPLLPPISPADAKRFCRITGKSYGLPSHHYTPVVLVKSTNSLGKCHITTKAEGQPAHHFVPGDGGGYKRHVVVSEYRYVFPVLDSSSQEQKLLTEVLAGKNGVSTPRDRFVYTVEERCCSLVLPANLEVAVRDGDVRDVMLAKDSDTMLLRLRQGHDITLDVKDVVMEEVDLWEGEGPTKEAQKLWEKDDIAVKKRKKKRNQGLKSVKKIFEEKERAAELEEMGTVQKKKAKIVEVKLSSTISEKPFQTEEAESKILSEHKAMSWDNFVPDFSRANTSLYVTHGDWRELVKPLVESWDWESVEKEMSRSSGVATITKLPTPIAVSIDDLDLSLSLPGLVQQPPAGTSGEIAGFEPVPAVVPFSPLLIEPDDDVQKAIHCISENLLEKTADVREILSNTDTLHSLPTSQDIPEIMENLEKGKEMRVSGKVNGCVHGLVLDIAAAQRFVPGQSVETPHGQVFVPGQTLQTPSGAIFVPGITVTTPDGPVLIPGQKVIADDNCGNKTPVFIAGQTLATRDGEKFVPGQTVQTPDGPRFVAGQTVYTKEGPKFVAGQAVAEKDGFRFIPGQTVMTEEGPVFVPGQTIASPQGNIVFIPGQNVRSNDDWEFVPGQAVKSSSAEGKFIQGQTLVTKEGTKFIPGQMVMDENKYAQQFVPGVTISDESDNLRFVPGKVVDTEEGPQFVEGQIVKTGSGKMFVPGKTCIADDNSVLEFATAKCLSDVIVKDISLDVSTIDPSSLKIVTSAQNKKHIFGHMVQTAHGVEFFPGPTEGLPAGKVVPGELLHSDDGEVHFVPGIISEDGNFIPGQIVMTEKGAQFVPGQVVDTREGPKFVPGQVVDTHSGPKFVPGQTVETPDGPRFVPGQIVETKAGPTFIPGQVISTEEEGSRFVPGQVVDTAEGPRFVPGRVVETSDRVTFIPGQIVNTGEGLHFVAPDLQGSSTGELEFSVQGFEVTPEELKLLQTHTVFAPCFTNTGEMTIDSEMLRQLSEAGMSVGRQVPTDIPAVDVNTTVTEPAMQIAHEITDKLGLEEKSAIKMGEVVAMVAHVGSEMLEHIKQKKYLSFGIRRGSAIEVESSMKGLAQAVVNAVVITAKDLRIKSEETFISLTGTVLEDILKDVVDLQPSAEDKAIQLLVDSLHSFFVKPGNITAICDKLISENVSKIDILREALLEEKNDCAVEKLMVLLQNGNSKDESLMATAFKVISKSHPEISKRVVHKVLESAKDVYSEQGVVSAIQRAVISAVKEGSEQCVLEMLDQGDQRGLLLQAVGLAQALGMAETTSSLLEVMSNPRSSQILYEDPLAASILRRLAVMRQLAEERPGLMSALERLQSDPSTAVLDPNVEQLIRESAALVGLPEEDEELPLESSDDIPSILFHNALALEEFIGSRKHYGPLLILKRGLQAVVPREAARAVLTGQIAYSVLDERGMRRFQPLHVLSALRLPRPASQWFSMYSCPVEEDSLLFTTTTATGTLTPLSGSLEDISHDMTMASGIRRRSPDTSVTSDTMPTYSKRGWSSEENTPSFRKAMRSRWGSDVVLRRSSNSEVKYPFLTGFHMKNLERNLFYFS
ncbi:hypothetical protein PR048_026589 [Dryococelus australis]|uniref:Uncharacterized protein n=1 Tax=Dryococelus australis TaxID=614101 RepID=A0ABQ9GLS2_9NEOP|nr:hypothetical protein PR048_026589 [Dryococelus australis]